MENGTKKIRKGEGRPPRRAGLVVYTHPRVSRDSASEVAHAAACIMPRCQAVPTDTAVNVATTLHIATLAIAQSVAAQGLAGYAQDFFRKSFLPVKGNSKIFYIVKNFSGTRYPPPPTRECTGGGGYGLFLRVRTQ